MYSDDSDFVLTPKRKKKSPEYRSAGTSKASSSTRTPHNSTARKKRSSTGSDPAKASSSASVTPGPSSVLVSPSVAGPAKASSSASVTPGPSAVLVSPSVAGPAKPPSKTRQLQITLSNPVPENYGSDYTSAAAKLLAYLFETKVIHVQTSNFTDICNVNPALKSNFELEDGRMSLEFSFTSACSRTFVRKLRREVTGFGPYLLVNIVSGITMLPLIPMRLQKSTISHLDYEIIGIITKHGHESFGKRNEGKWMSMTTMEPVPWSEMIRHLVSPMRSVIFGLKERFLLEPLEKPGPVSPLSDSHKQSLFDCFHKKHLRKIISDTLRRMPTPQKKKRTKLQLLVIEHLKLKDSETEFKIDEKQYNHLVSIIPSLNLEEGRSRIVVKNGAINRLRSASNKLIHLCKVCLITCNRNVRIGFHNYCPLHYPPKSPVVYVVFRYHARINQHINSVDLSVIGSDCEWIPKAPSFGVGHQLYGARINALTAKVDAKHIYLHNTITDANCTLFALRVMNVLDTVLNGRPICFERRKESWLETDFFDDFNPPPMQTICSNFGFEVVIEETVEPYTLQRSLNTGLAFVPEGYWCTMPRVYTRVYKLNDDTNVIYVGKCSSDRIVTSRKSRYFPEYQFSSIAAVTPHEGLIATIESACQQAYAIASLFGIRKYGKKIILRNQMMELVDNCLETCTFLELVQTIFAQEFGKWISFRKT